MLAGLAFTGWAQTNLPPVEDQWLALSEPHLRGESLLSTRLEIPQAEPSAATTATNTEITFEKGQPSSALAITTSSLNGENTDAWLNPRDFDLIVPPPPVPPNALERSLDQTFRPEVIHLGRQVTASCSVWTAIKRKNPLCLLNLTVLNVSW